MLFLLLTFIVIVFTLIFFLSPVSSNKSGSSSKRNYSVETFVDNQTNTNESNIIKESITKAAQVPKLYYKYLNEKNYEEVINK
ncbi:hypothetical protein CN946_08625 [Bacillus sp. AFS053548]|nr:hypothetical protein CN946_08625 [Bacillus sp. AFS053548]